jgi:cytochrome P450
MDEFAAQLETTRNMATSDPPDHTAMRRFLAKRFTPKRIEAWTSKVQGFADDLIDDLIEAQKGGSADLAHDYAYSLPLIIIAEMLGVPYERRQEFRRWSDQAVGVFSGAPLTQEVQMGCLQLAAFFAEQVAIRRANPGGDDLISLLIEKNPDDDPEAVMDDGVIVQTCTLLLIAGHETTANLLCNATLSLMEHPEQRKELENDFSLIPNMVEEVLRWNSPIQAVYRATTRDVEVAGVTIPKDKTVLCCVGAANRDENIFANANQFDIHRDIEEHLGLGSGNHYCIGAHLSRIEGRIGMETLLRRTRNMQLSGEPTRALGNILRGWTHLPVKFDVVEQSESTDS